MFCSLTKFLFYKNLCNTVLRKCNVKHEMRSINSYATSVYNIETLNDRGVLRLSGNETLQFIQGLITNDIKHLEEGSRSMYTMFLNSKGRVMYDAIIYKDFKTPAIYIECDKIAVCDLLKHLKMFKVRRKIDINIVDNYKVWAIFSPNIVDEVNKFSDVTVKDVLQENVVPCQAVNLYTVDSGGDSILDLISNENLCVSIDPRLADLGVRILAENTVNITDVAKKEGVQVGELKTPYKVFRYSLGIAEGVNELPYGKCFPLEMNCDYLHGVSFHKGCYIGQELTARTHHTGVVRKRLMPIYLDSTIKSSDQFPFDLPIEVGDGKAVGKLRGIENNVAIGLLRISDALNAGKLNIGNITGHTIKPQWWPQEAPKETLISKKK